MDALCVPYFVSTVGTERVCCSTGQYRPEPAGTELLRANLSALVSVVSTSTCRYQACGFHQHLSVPSVWFPPVLVGTERVVSTSTYRTERVVSTSTCRYRAYVQGITELLRGNLSALVGTERVCQLTASQ